MKVEEKLIRFKKEMRKKFKENLADWIELERIGEIFSWVIVFLFTFSLIHENKIYFNSTKLFNNYFRLHNILLLSLNHASIECFGD